MGPRADLAASRLVRAALRRHRELLVVTLLALIVRLIWNLRVHPPLDYVYADMGGYLERARTGIDHPDGRFGYFTFFPWGTHVLLGFVMRLFGRDPRTAVGVLYAVMGALSVSFTFALARRFARQAWVPRVVGAVLVLYYPWISLGGYVLSEAPFTLFLGATAWAALRLADRGRPRDAWLLGLCIAVASIFRPQILISMPLLPCTSCCCGDSTSSGRTPTNRPFAPTWRPRSSRTTCSSCPRPWSGSRSRSVVAARAPCCSRSTSSG